MEITGKVIARLEKRSGTSAKGKSWVSQEYVVEHGYDTQYPKKAVLGFFGEELVKEAQQLLHKDTIATFFFDVNAREVTTSDNKKRWFQSLDCFRFTIPQQTAPVGNGASVAPQPTPQPAPAPVVNGGGDTTDPFLNEQPSDDLPF